MPPALVTHLAEGDSTVGRLARRVHGGVRRRLADLIWSLSQALPLRFLPGRTLRVLVPGFKSTAMLEQMIERLDEAERRPHRRLLDTALLERGQRGFRDAEPDHGYPWFERAGDAAPTAEIWTWRGFALRRLGRLRESLAAGEAAVDVDDTWGLAYVHLGNLHHQLGNRDASVDAWVRLLRARRPSRYQLRRAWIGLERVRELDLALEVADRLLRRNRRDAEARAMRAVALWELRRRDEAERAIADLHGRSDRASVRGLAWYLGRTRRSNAARELLAQHPAETIGSGPFVELFHMLRRDGHLRAAGEVAEQASDAFPHHPELARLAREIAGELRVFTGAWADGHSDAPASARPVDPIRGRVLHVVGRSVPHAATGYCVRTDRTVRAQRDLGVDVHVATQLGFPWEEGGDAPFEEIVNGVAHHRLPIPDDARLPLELDRRLDLHVAALDELVMRLRPAVLHAASDFRNALVALEVGRRHDLPVIYEMRGFWEETWLAKREGEGADSDTYLLRRERELDAAQRATRVVTLATTMRDVLVERGVPADKISLAPNAVDPDDFPLVDRDDTLARRLGIPDDATVVGYISSFVGYEGIHVLIDAVARLRADGAPVVALLVGDGLVRPELERQARELGIADDVIFTGRVPHADIRAYYELIDAFVVPRTNARVCQLVSPLKPFEAMAAGRALIMSGTPVLRSLIDEGMTGLSFTPEDADDLATTIAPLVDDPDLRTRLGAAARAHVLEHHTWQRNAERYLDLYRQIAVGFASPSGT